MDVTSLLEKFGATRETNFADGLVITSPIDGSAIGSIELDTQHSTSVTIASAAEASRQWRSVPAPVRGELIRRLGEALRANKSDLAKLVSIENGKILTEGLGEVQEMIDICDFAVGLSRQLYGLTIASERPGHTLREQWHPLGVCAVITAFNFPVAVWSWNAALALVCGNSVIWKPSEKTPLTAIAVQAIFDSIIDEFDDAPEGLSTLVLGASDIGQQLVEDPRVDLVSATGSTAMGRAVGQVAAKRFAKVILELGGNNAVIVAPSADLEQAVRGIVFSAVGTAGQRCTTLRRLIVHEEVYDVLVTKLKSAYLTLPIGSPLEPATLVGPLVDQDAYDNMQKALDSARSAGATVTGGNRVQVSGCDDGFYVTPAIVESDQQLEVACSETFAPIMYVTKYRELSEAIETNNAVPQGLSSSIFTTNLKEAELFMSATGSDCGLANVNVGPSGAEIGGAFGGEKETGGGRESGSDSWRGYMRRQTNTVNYSDELPLAQGVTFGVE